MVRLKYLFKKEKKTNPKASPLYFLHSLRCWSFSRHLPWGTCGMLIFLFIHLFLAASLQLPPKKGAKTFEKIICKHLPWLCPGGRAQSVLRSRRVLRGWCTATSHPRAGRTPAIPLMSAFYLPGAAHVFAEDRAKIHLRQRLFKVRLTKAHQEFFSLTFDEGREKWAKRLHIWNAASLWITKYWAPKFDKLSIFPGFGFFLTDCLWGVLKN